MILELSPFYIKKIIITLQELDLELARSYLLFSFIINHNHPGSLYITLPALNTQRLSRSG